MKQKARLVIPLWGLSYCQKFKDLTLPALLAPGNLDALSERFSLEIVLVTEHWIFEDLQELPLIQKIKDIADFSYRPVEDLMVGSWYGISLTRALSRGFADLGEQMKDTYVFFLNADFVISAGAYKSVIQEIDRGATVICAPSYCVVEEDVYHKLAYDHEREGDLNGWAPRELARIVLDHRHMTIRAKTVNQQGYKLHRQDQYYFVVDDDTLLGRQMPVSLICMRPEVYKTDIECFWDYGVVEEYAPNSTYCVLGDSDDFLMLELRSRDTFSDLISFGEATQEEIALDLSESYPKNHFEMGRFDLCLHASDIAADFAEKKSKFDRYMDSLYSLLPEEPIHHLNHPFWVQDIAAFNEARAKALSTESNTEPTGIEFCESDAGSEDQTHRDGGQGLINSRNVPPRFEKLAARIHTSAFGRETLPPAFHPLHSFFDEFGEEIEDCVSRPGSKILISLSGSDALEEYILHNAPGAFDLGNLGSAHIAIPSTLAEKKSVDLAVVGALGATEEWIDRLKDYERTVNPIMKNGGRVIYFATFEKKMSLTGAQFAHKLPETGERECFFFNANFSNSSIKQFNLAREIFVFSRFIFKARFVLPLFIGLVRVLFDRFTGGTGSMAKTHKEPCRGVVIKVTR